MLHMSLVYDENGAAEKAPEVFFTGYPDNFKQNFDNVRRDFPAYWERGITHRESGNAGDASLSDVKLIVVLVDSRLLSEDDPETDRVLDDARSRGIPVLPVLMEPELGARFAEDKRFDGFSFMMFPNGEDGRHRYVYNLLRYLECLDVFWDAAADAQKRYGRTDDGKPAAQILAAARKESCAAMMVCADMYWFGQGVGQDPDEAVRWCEKYVESVEEAYGSRSMLVRFGMKKLIRYCSTAGREEKEKLWEDRLDDILRVTAEKEPDSGDLETIRWEIEYGRETLEMLEQDKTEVHFGPPEHDVARECKWLSHLYGLTGDYQEGIRYGKRAAEGSEPAVREWLVFFYYQTGQYKAAIKTGESLLWKPDGENDRGFYIFSVADWLFLSYEKAGRYKKGIALGEKTYEARSRILGKEHEKTLLAMSGLVRLYDKIRYYKKGAAMGESLCEMMNLVFGGEASGTLKEMRKLATLYGDGGSYDKAAALMEKVYQIQSRNAGEEELHYPAAALFHYYQKLGDYRKAAVYGEKLCGIRKTLFGEEDERTQAALRSLAALENREQAQNG